MTVGTVLGVMFCSTNRDGRNSRTDSIKETVKRLLNVQQKA